MNYLEHLGKDKKMTIIPKRADCLKHVSGAPPLRPYGITWI